MTEPVHRDKAEKKLLTGRKIKNREKLVSDFDDLLAEPGNELGVEMPAKVRKAQQDYKPTRTRLNSSTGTTSAMRVRR